VFITFFASVPSSFYNKKTLSAIIHLPKAFFIMFLTLFKLRGANKSFIHTPHTSNQPKQNHENRN
jgi:hypothetical protein